MESFFQALDGISVSEEDLRSPEGISLDTFYQLTSYLGSSPRLLDTAILTTLMEGNPQPPIAGLASHMLMAAGGTAARALRGVSVKGVSNPMAKTAAKLTSQLKKVMVCVCKLEVKAVSANTTAGALSGVLMRLVDSRLVFWGPRPLLPCKSRVCRASKRRLT